MHVSEAQHTLHHWRRFSFPTEWQQPHLMTEIDWAESDLRNSTTAGGSWLVSHMSSSWFVCKIHFNNILPCTPRFSTWSLFWWFTRENSVGITSLPVCYTLHPSHHPRAPHYAVFPNLLSRPSLWISNSIKTWRSSSLYTDATVSEGPNASIFGVEEMARSFSKYRGTLPSTSGHYMYRQFNIQHSTFCPHTVFMCFVWIWEQTAIISLYSINWLVCITETQCVYCAIRAEYLYII